MKPNIRIFKCDRCGATAYTTDNSTARACNIWFSSRTSGICGGHYSEIKISADLGWIIEQEVESRILERIPGDKEIKDKALELAPIVTIPGIAEEEDVNQYCREDFIKCMKWLSSRFMIEPSDTSIPVVEDNMTQDSIMGEDWLNEAIHSGDFLPDQVLTRCLDYKTLSFLKKYHVDGISSAYEKVAGAMMVYAIIFSGK